jgi:quercetin dioxygenase-like cupin family protein
MRKSAISAVVIAFVSTLTILAQPVTSAAAPVVVRKILMQKDVAGGQTLTLVKETIPVGGREGSHTHPGPAMVYVMSGAFWLDYDGKPNATYKAGDTFFIEANHVHEGINKGNEPAVAIVTFLTPKGQPLTKQQ